MKIGRLFLCLPLLVRAVNDETIEGFDVPSPETEEHEALKLCLLQTALRVRRAIPVESRFNLDLLQDDATLLQTAGSSLQQAEDMSSIEAQARLEAAQAMADQAAAEAEAVEELKRAEDAAKRAKAAWAKVNHLHNKIDGDVLPEPILPTSLQALEAGRKEATLALLKLQDPNVEVIPAELGAITSETNSTAEDPRCLEDKHISCPMQRVITFDYKLSLTWGLVEWFGLLALWLMTLRIACCVCTIGSSTMCCCQFLSLLAIFLVGLGTAESWFK
jgi:hypothetical protein